MDSAKVFMTGRSQAVRLPAYRFDADEVLIERQPTGVFPYKTENRLRTPACYFAGLPDDPAFNVRTAPLERDAAWWLRMASFGDQRGGAQAQAADEALMYLLDTNICVYVIRQRPEAVYRRLSDAAGESVALS